MSSQQLSLRSILVLITNVTTTFVSSALLMVTAFGLVMGGMIACTKKNDETLTTKAASGKRIVNLAIWANYLSSESQEKFTRETGIEIRVTNYSSNEELLAKVQAGATGIDLAVPSDYMVEVMNKLGLLQPLDTSKIPNKKSLDVTFMNQEYDPENRFSLPYSWTTSGIAINRELFKSDQPNQIKGWKDLFNNKDLAGKISLLDDAREVTAAALKMHGYSVNTVNPEELGKAKATLKELRPRIKMFRSDTIDPLLNKEVSVAHAYSPDALQAAQRSGGKIEFIIPEEGGTRAIDNLVILKSAKNVEEAHALINFFLTKESNASFVEKVRGGPVVMGAREMLPDDIKNNNALFPPPAVWSKLERIKDVGEATRLYDRLWTEIKAE